MINGYGKNKTWIKAVGKRTYSKTTTVEKLIHFRERHDYGENKIGRLALLARLVKVYDAFHSQYAEKLRNSKPFLAL